MPDLEVPCERIEGIAVKTCGFSLPELQQAFTQHTSKLLHDGKNTPGQDRTGDLQRVRLTS